MDRYTFIVVGLCVAVIAAYFIVGPTLLAPRQESPAPAHSPVPPRSAAPLTDAPGIAAAPTPVIPTPGPAAPSPSSQPTAPAAKPAEIISVETDLFRAVFTNRGAALRSLTLLDYYTTAREKELAKDAERKGTIIPGNLELLGEIADGEMSLVLSDAEHGFERIVYDYELSDIAEDGSRELVFRGHAGELEVTKTFSFRNGQRAIGVSVEVRNLSKQAVRVAYRLRSAAGLAPEQQACPLSDARVNLDRNAQAAAPYTKALIAARISELKLLTYSPRKGAGGGCMCIPIGRSATEYKPYEDRPVVWAGVENTYFAALLAPMNADRHGAVPGPITDLNVTCDLLARPADLAPGEVRSEQYLFYVGPKDMQELAQFADQRFAFLLEPKGFNPMARIGQVLGWLLRLLHSIIPNYGVAIILLTVLVRAVLHPLTRTSQRSMYRMQKLQPRVAEVRERFKNDRQRMNEEMMKLYRESGVNPVGGCLPMLLQLPILIGLFTYLRQAIELRQQPFVWWIRDLSQPDAVWCLQYDIPVIGRAINILPILMIGAMVVQQKFTPKSQDPQQQQTQKMMALMPVIFGFLFYNMASGLVLYWLVSTGLGLLEQWYLTNRLKEADAAGPSQQRSSRNLKLRKPRG